MYLKAKAQLARSRAKVRSLKGTKGGGNLLKFGAGAIGGGAVASLSKTFLSDISPVDPRIVTGVGQAAVGAYVVKKGALADGLVASGAGTIACYVEDVVDFFFGDEVSDDSEEG